VTVRHAYKIELGNYINY